MVVRRWRPTTLCVQDEVIRKRTTTTGGRFHELPPIWRGTATDDVWQSVGLDIAEWNSGVLIELSLLAEFTCLVSRRTQSTRRE